MVQTSSVRHAQTLGEHLFTLQAGGVTRSVNLTTPSGGIVQGKGDLWKLSLKTDFDFPGCVTIKHIQNMALQENHNDGWNIDSIVTFLVVNPYYWALSSVDFDVNRWIDGNGANSAKQFILSLCV